MTRRKKMFTRVTHTALSAILFAFALTSTAHASVLDADSAQVAAARHLALGNTLYEQGQFEKAVAEYTEAARLGNAEAQFDLGYAYYNGEGAEKDYATAARWFKTSGLSKMPCK